MRGILRRRSGVGCRRCEMASVKEECRLVVALGPHLCGRSSRQLDTWPPCKLACFDTDLEEST